MAPANHSGNYVCTNGAASGEHCAVKVYNVDGSTHIIDAKRTKDKARAIAKGDSGGPVLSEQVAPTDTHCWRRGRVATASVVHFVAIRSRRNSAAASMTSSKCLLLPG